MPTFLSMDFFIDKMPTFIPINFLPQAKFFVGNSILPTSDKSTIRGFSIMILWKVESKKFSIMKVIKPLQLLSLLCSLSRCHKANEYFLRKFIPNKISQSFLMKFFVCCCFFRLNLSTALCRFQFCFPPRPPLLPSTSAPLLLLLLIHFRIFHHNLDLLSVLLYTWLTLHHRKLYKQRGAGEMRWEVGKSAEFSHHTLSTPCDDVLRCHREQNFVCVSSMNANKAFCALRSHF